MPVPGGTSGARDQDEGPHENPPESGGQVWEITILHRVSPNVVGQRLWRSRSRGHRAPITALQFSATGPGRTSCLRSADPLSDPVSRSSYDDCQDARYTLATCVAALG